MQGFQPKRATVVLTRGDSSLSFEVSPLPAGFRADLHAAFPPPRRYVNGKDAGADDSRGIQWADLLGYAILAKALEPSGALSAPCVNLSMDRSVIEKQARAIRDEFRAANLTDGEVGELVKAVDGLNSDVTVADLGNSPGD